MLNTINDGHIYHFASWNVFLKKGDSLLFLVSQKPFLSDDHRVDYVQVDEKKTQALQNTKMEWKDVRQSKTWSMTFQKSINVSL